MCSSMKAQCCTIEIRAIMNPDCKAGQGANLSQSFPKYSFERHVGSCPAEASISHKGVIIHLLGII